MVRLATQKNKGFTYKQTLKQVISHHRNYNVFNIMFLNGGD